VAATASGCFVAVSVFADLYDLASLFSQLHLGVPQAAINVIVPAAVLLLGGTAFWAAGRRAR